MQEISFSDLELPTPERPVTRTESTEQKKGPEEIHISPMSFHPGVPSRGRKKKKRQGAPTMNNRKKIPSETRSDSADSEEEPPKKRGRVVLLGLKINLRTQKKKVGPRLLSVS